MENDLLDDIDLEQELKIKYPVYFIVIAIFNVVLTFWAYTGIYSKINGEASMAIVESEGSLAFIQAIYWVLLVLLIDIGEAFQKAIKERKFLKKSLDILGWLLVSIPVIFFVTALILIPRIIFILIIFTITSVSEVNFESIVLSTPYVLFTIFFITGILFLYHKPLQTES